MPSRILMARFVLRWLTSNRWVGSGGNLRWANRLLNVERVTSFFDGIELVCLDVVEDLPLPAGPVDFDGFSARGIVQTEVGPQIALGKVTPSAGDFADLRDSASQDADACSHSVSIAFCAYQFEIQKMLT